MRYLNEILKESLLDDNVGDDSIVPMFFNILMNTKSIDEFGSLIKNL